MTKKLDITKPPFQTNENPPRKVELLKDHFNNVSDHTVAWLVTNYSGTQFTSTSRPDGTSPHRFSIVNAPRPIPFWIKLNSLGNIEYTRMAYRPHTDWRGPFWMDEDGNPVSGVDE